MGLMFEADTDYLFVLIWVTIVILSGMEMGGYEESGNNVVNMVSKFANEPNLVA